MMIFLARSGGAFVGVESLEVRRDRQMVQTATAFLGWLPAESRFCTASAPRSFPTLLVLAISLDLVLTDSERLLGEGCRWSERCWCPSGRA